MIKMLDLCCGAGGASAGYASLGWKVVGVDYRAQPRYPYTFIQADALEVLSDETFVRDFDFIHASFPCQHFLKGTMKSKSETFDLLTPGRALLEKTGLPWILENVMTAPLDKCNSVVLCGNSFKLRTYRHRRFEFPPSMFTIKKPFHRHHIMPSVTTKSELDWEAGYFFTFTGGATYESQGPIWNKYGKGGMGIDWMTRFELSQAIPPAYTKWIGNQVISNYFEKGDQK